MTAESCSRQIEQGEIEQQICTPVGVYVYVRVQFVAGRSTCILQCLCIYSTCTVHVCAALCYIHMIFNLCSGTCQGWGQALGT